ncbi:hypothetical protein RD792_004858 [Penstemon davidsonii]|uniref:Response regulatory domain-containing protein n=1 Tax=Penstemon davidsonii TaxID=160366 RepID=A0ABR0DIJ6_9LAMI|nr:hypothetical protein RD792_004858 [Penstemon davidsonii]
MVLVKKQRSNCSSNELHVLAVDDSFVDRKVVERLLKISSCKVTVVESGRSALQFLGLDGETSCVGFDELKVNLIMTDYSMPGMTGYELLKKIKGSSKLREIPVVVMSSENIMTRIDSCIEEGAEEFLVKPLKLSDVERLKDFILKGDDKNRKNNNSNSLSRKRKSQDDLVLPMPMATLCSARNHDFPSQPKSMLDQPLQKQPRLVQTD